MTDPRTVGRWRAEIGAESWVFRPDGSRIDFGDAIYHPAWADEARAYADRMNALASDPEPTGLDVEVLYAAMRSAGFRDIEGEDVARVADFYRDEAAALAQPSNPSGLRAEQEANSAVWHASVKRAQDAGEPR